MEQMETVLNRISEIEAAAVSLEQKAVEEKKEIAARYGEKTKAFDMEIDRQTQEKLKSLNEKLKAEAENELLKMRRETEQELSAVEKEFSLNHRKMAEAIFRRVTGEA